MFLKSPSLGLVVVTLRSGMFRFRSTDSLKSLIEIILESFAFSALAISGVFPLGCSPLAMSFARAPVDFGLT